MLTPLVWLVGLVAASLLCLDVWCSPHLQTLFVSHEVCLWNVSNQKDSVRSCDLLDEEVTTAFPSEEGEAMREWRPEFPEQLRRVIVRIHTNLGRRQNSTLAKMISDAGGSEELDQMCDSVSVFCVQANVPTASPTSCVSSKNPTVQ